MVERFNGTLMTALKKMTLEEPSHWDLYLPSVLYAYRTKVHQSTKLSP